MKKQGILAATIAATLGTSGAADAAMFGVVLTSHGSYSNGGLSSLNITSSTATWQYDSTTGLVSQSGGLYNARMHTTPTVTIFRHSITGLVIGGGSAASATSFVCTEGNFGGGVGASLCGNYSLGANFFDESSTTWGPGTAFARTIGGDDAAMGPQRSIHAYDGMSTLSWDGTTLVLTNRTCTGPCFTWLGAYNNGYLMTWTTVVPIPAAVWLFSGALAALGWLRRRQATA